jgi:hypothetical protein
MMAGNGYSADDNRSMQLNDNNDRYYSSRGIDRDDDDYSEEEYNSITGQGKPPGFIKYIPFEDWLAYFKVWIQNLKINTGEPYITESLVQGVRTMSMVDHFTGFNYWNEDHKTLWLYSRIRAMIDYCTDKGLEWTVECNGHLWEYRVQDWSNFAFDGNNIMTVNRIIYENNGLEFPSNAEDLFLTRIMTNEKAALEYRVKFSDEE